MRACRAKFRRWFGCLLLLAWATASRAEPAGDLIGQTAAVIPRIAIIIDDLGYQYSAGRRAISLPGPVACAVLPHTPRGVALAEAAHANGKEVLLHLPLQSVGGHTGVGPGGITLDMDRLQFAAAFASGIDSVPYAIGVNNHMGSLLTRHPGHMDWLMQEIKQRGELFFVDSFTTHHSVALQLASEVGVPAVKRDVFLDPDRTAATVRREFDRLKQHARRYGQAVGIGHPYPTTLALLERELPGLAAEGYELVTISEIIGLRQPADASRPAAAARK